MSKRTYTTDDLERIEAYEWLTDRQSDVFDLYYHKGWRIEDIAADLKVHRRTIDRILGAIHEIYLSLK